MPSQHWVIIAILAATVPAAVRTDGPVAEVVVPPPTNWSEPVPFREEITDNRFYQRYYKSLPAKRFRTETESNNDDWTMTFVSKPENNRLDDNRGKRSVSDEPDIVEQMAVTCRFPEYAQGQWSNLRIDGGVIRYVYAYYADDFDNEGIYGDSEGQGDDGADGDAELKPRRRIRRESEDPLMETLASIADSRQSMPVGFNVTEFILKHNVSDIPLDGLDSVVMNMFKPAATSTAGPEKIDLLIPYDADSTGNDDDVDDDTENKAETDRVEVYRKIVAMQRLWDEKLRTDARRAFDLFTNYGFPEPSIGDGRADDYDGEQTDTAMLETWDSFKSLFEFGKPTEEQPIFPPTPPGTPPPPTPPNTPPRPSSADDRSLDGHDVTAKRNDDELGPVDRKKRCFGSGGSSTTTSVPGDLHEINRDKNMDTIEKFNREHDPLHLDTLLPSGNANNARGDKGGDKPSLSGANAKTPSTLEPSVVEKLLNEIKRLLAKITEPAKVEHKRRPVPAAGGRGYATTNRDVAADRQKRAAEDDDNDYHDPTYYMIERAVKLAPIIEEEVEKDLKNWYTIFRNHMMAYYSKKYQLARRLKEVQYHKYPEMRPVPTVLEFLGKAKALGLPYKMALLMWRRLEREHRAWLAELEYVTFPGQNHPAVYLADFDHTYKDIEMDFDPWHPEGTENDPTAYLVYTAPGGGPRIGSRMTRRDVWAIKKNLGGFGMLPADLSVRAKRDADSIPLQQGAGPQKFAWRCVQPVDEYSAAAGDKYLTLGGRYYDEEDAGRSDHSEELKFTNGNEDANFRQTYGCLSLVARGPNVLEFSILATGVPRSRQDLTSFARELCAENEAPGRDSNVRNKKKLRPRRRWWFTETRPDEKNRVQVSCPVPPGTVFYGVVPAPPPPPQSSDPRVPPSGSVRQMCARLVSAADDCQPGEAGRSDRMKYTVSECVDQQITVDGTLPPEVVAPPKPENVFEERSYQCLGQWTEMQQNGPGEPSVLLTYTFVKRLDSSNPGAPEYECFVGTTVPNDPGRDQATTTTLMLTEAGTGNRCSRLADPFKSGMKLVGTKIGLGAACAGTAGRSATDGGGSWYSLRPQELTTTDKDVGKMPFSPPKSPTVPSVPAGSFARNPPGGRKDMEHVSVRPAPPPKEGGGVVFQSSSGLAFIGLLCARLLLF